MAFFFLGYNIDIINIWIKQSIFYSAFKIGVYKRIDLWQCHNIQSKNSDSTNTK